MAGAGGNRGLHPVLLILTVPVVQRIELRHQPNAAEIDLARAGVEGDLVRTPGSVGQVGESSVAGPEGVRDSRSRRSHDHVPPSDWVLALAQEERPSTLEGRRRAPSRPSGSAAEGRTFPARARSGAGPFGASLAARPRSRTR